jgi:hypothetical protein
MIAFFMIVALTVFDRLESLGQQKTRPDWFPLGEHNIYRTVDKDHNLIGPKEQGSRVAGYALSPLFGWYFLLQGVCGFLAVATALAWPRREPGRKVHRVRVALIMAAVVTVVIAWPLDQKVDALREPRHKAVEAFLKDRTPANLDAAVTTKQEFALWHGLSLVLNFITFGLVGMSLALASQLPEKDPLRTATDKPRNTDQQTGGSDPPRVLTHSS